MKNNDPLDGLDTNLLGALLRGLARDQQQPPAQLPIAPKALARPRIAPLKPIPAPATGIDDDDALDTPYPCPPELDLLRTHQRWALEELMGGKNYTEAAQGAQVNRKTLFNWVNKDPAFIAAMEAWRKRAVQSAEDRLAGGTEAAAATLVAAAARDYRAAAMLLKGRGLLGGASKRSAEDIIAQVMSLPPSKRKVVELRLRELILSFREEPAPGPATPAPPIDAIPPRAQTALSLQAGEKDQEPSSDEPEK
jgi:hypothetical protein